jgi:hypothetical protein
LPAPWVDADIGSPALAGGASWAAGVFTVNGAGVDIEGGSDQFHFVYQPVSGDVTVIARVASIQNTNSWAKGGVMIRETLVSNSRHAMMALTPGNGLAFQRRLATGGGTSNTSGALVAAPYWVKLVRLGNTLSGYASPDGVTWTLVGSDTVVMSTNVFVGLPLTSHNGAAVCTATFDSTSVTVTTGGPLPAPWVDADIGSPALSGSASYSGTTFTVNGAGVDIWDTSDQFHYVYQPMSNNNLTIIARVATIEPTDAWAKGGVMIRETLNANSRHAMMVITSSNGASFQRRVATNGFSTDTTVAGRFVPYWVKLVRSGATFSGYASPDGVTWTLIGTDSIGMTTSVFIGLPVTSHSSPNIGTDTFDSVSVSSP